MADNTTLPSGSGGDTLRSEDRGSYKTPVSLIDVGGVAGEALIGDGTNAMPIKDGGNSITVDDGSGSLTVDGTVAATQSGTWNVTNVSGTVSLPTGASTAVNQDTGNASLLALTGALASVGDTSVLVSNGGTFVTQVNGAALTALQLLDNIVLAEDAAHSSGDPGVQSLAVRNDSDASLASTTGDYTPLQVDSNGYLKVNIKAGAGSGGTALTDDAAFTAATTSFTPIGGIVTADSVDSGDGGAFAMLANRQQKVTLYDSSGSELAVGGGTQYDEDAVHSSGSKVTGAGVVRKDTATSLAGTDGDYSLLIVDANGRLHVNPSLPTGAATEQTLTDIFGLLGGSIGVTDAGGSLTVDGTVAISGTVTVGSHAVTNAGTFAVQAACTNAGTFVVQVDGNALTALQLIDDVIFVDDAAFTLGTSKIAAVGGRASRARRTAETADGDAGVLALDRYGRAQVAGIDLTVSATQVTASGDTSLVAAPGAGSRLKILRIEASNSHATVAVTAGLKSTSLNSGNVFGKKYLPALGGMATWTFPNGHLMCGDNEAFSANLSAGSTTIEYTIYYEVVLT